MGDERLKPWSWVYRLKSVFLIGWFHRALPGTVELFKHLLGRRPAGIDDAVERLQMPRLVAAERVDAAATPQPGMCQDEAFLGDFEEIAVPDPRLEAEARHVVAQGLALMRAPMLHHIPRGIERHIVIEQPDPERRQRRQPAPRAAIGAAHLEIALEPDLREDRREMVGPIRQCRTLARQVVV